MNMVVGKGVISNRFIDYSLQSQFLIFAGSIHDSRATDQKAIEDEEQTLKRILIDSQNITIVYFSSCSVIGVNVRQTLYTSHKLRMEHLIQEFASKYIIIRLPQLLATPDTASNLINFYVNAIFNGRHFELWENSKANVIDIDDVYDIVVEILHSGDYINKVINVASPHNTSTLEIVRSIEKFFECTAIFRVVNNDDKVDIDISSIKEILIKKNITFPEDYIFKGLVKYFSHLKRRIPLISIVVPTFNEESGIDEFYRRVKNVLITLSPRFDHEIIFVNDASTDDTFLKLKYLADKDEKVKLVNLSRNFGNQIAITAGIDFSNGELMIIIDDDLQDPPEIIVNFIAKWDRGYKVVYGVRPKRQGVNFLFKFVAKVYYRALNSLSEINIPNDTGDFRLIDRVAVNVLKNMREENRYYRGMVAWVGFTQTGVTYERDRRYAGTSTFSVKKYINFALNGLTSFTEKPLYFSSLAGLLITSFSFCLAVGLVISKIIDPTVSIRGWTSLTVIMLFFGGIQLLSTGILGFYVSKIYREVKGRPLYVVRELQNISTERL